MVLELTALGLLSIRAGLLNNSDRAVRLGAATQLIVSCTKKNAYMRESKDVRQTFEE